MYRKTYALINLKNIENNIKKIINYCKEYKYYIGVVKADAYGHSSIKTIKSIIKGGCNYLAVSSLDEALEIRKSINNIDILCLGVIDINYIDVCIKNNIVITINSKEYLDDIILANHNGLKCQIKVNTGMNRLGVNNKDDFNYIYNNIMDSTIILEGIYTHIYNANNETDTNNQFKKFEDITHDIDLKSIKMVHLTASESTLKYKKRDYVNACRLGICMYGFINNSNINLLSTFSLYSEVIQINKVTNETVGYNGTYKVSETELIAVVSIGYADGIIRKNTGRDVFINNKRYKIVGDICMDMLFVKVDDSVKIHDKVAILKDNDHINEVAKYLDTINYEVICNVGKRVPRIYK